MPRAVSAGPSPRTKRSKIWVRIATGMPGPSSATSTTASSPCSQSRSSIVAPSGRVAGGVVEQVEDHPVELVGAAFDPQRPLVVDLEMAAAHQRRRLERARRRRSRPGHNGGGGRAARRRRAPAAAGRTTRRLIRREERSAESTISRSSACPGTAERGLEQLEVGEDAGQRRAQLVRGVGDEFALLLHRLLAAPSARPSSERSISSASSPVRRPRLRPAARACVARCHGCRRFRGRWR